MRVCYSHQSSSPCSNICPDSYKRGLLTWINRSIIKLVPGCNICQYRNSKLSANNAVSGHALNKITSNTHPIIRKWTLNYTTN